MKQPKQICIVCKAKCKCKDIFEKDRLISLCPDCLEVYQQAKWDKLEKRIKR